MNNQDDPLPKKCLKLLVGVVFFTSSNFISATPPAVLEAPQAIIIRGNSVVAMASPGYERTLASLTGIPELDRIIEAESDNRWWVKNPYSSAFGYCQFLKQTRDYVEGKWKMTIDWQDPEQQLYACKRLYLEESNRHWKESRSEWDK